MVQIFNYKTDSFHEFIITFFNLQLVLHYLRPRGTCRYFYMAGQICDVLLYFGQHFLDVRKES